MKTHVLCSGALMLGFAVLLAAWPANKTPETVAAWIGHPGNAVLLADAAGLVIGVVALTAVGEGMLSQVAPDARFQGAVIRQLQRLTELGARSVLAA